MRDTDFDPADAACWIARGRRPDHAALIAAAWRDYPDLPPSAPLADRMARSRARIAAMNPVNEQIRLDHAREQEASNFAFTESHIRQGRGSAQDTAILEGRDRHGYAWLRSVVYGQGWYAAQAGWDYRPPGPNLRGIVPAGTTEAYAQGFADGGGRHDDLFDAARRQFAAAGRVAGVPAQAVAPSGRPLPSNWPKPDDAHRSVAWSRRLVILAANSLRADIPAGPAIDLLDDPLARAVRAVPGSSLARIVILSAAHGFIDGHAPRVSWTEAMTPARADALCVSREARAQLAALLTGEIDDILVAAQGDYLRIVDAYATALPLCRVMERTRNTPLQQRAHVRTWLARGRDAGENVGAGHIRWSKLIHGLTGKLGEFTARYGGKAIPRGHRIVIEVAPGVPATGYVTAGGSALCPVVVISNKAHLRVGMAKALRTFAAATRLAMAA